MGFVVRPLALAAVLLSALPSLAGAAGATIPASGRTRAVVATPSPPGETVAHPRSHAALPLNAAGLAAAKRQAALGGLTAPTPGQSAPAPRAVAVSGLNQAGLTAGLSSPSDSTGAIGPNHYVEFVNSEVGVYNRSDLSLASSRNLDAFVGKTGDSVFDPQIQWDQQGRRWLYLADDIGGTAQNPTNRLAFGWSKTVDPTDLVNGWCSYTLDTGSLFEDFPKLGHDDTHIVFGTNAFDANNNFVTAHIWALPKPAVGDETTCPAAPTVAHFGSASALLRNADNSKSFTPVPANAADSSSSAYVLAAHDAYSGPASKLTVWHVGGTPTAPTLSAPTDIAVGSFAMPAPVPQPGTSDVIDSSDTRLDQVIAHADPGAGGAEALWAQHTIDGPGGRSAVRWYEVLAGTATVRQQATITDGSAFLFNAAISPDDGGQGAAIFYNAGSASPSQLVDVRGQTHQAHDPLNTMGGEITLATSDAADEDFTCPAVDTDPPCRWGDYAAATPDPSPTSATTVWGTSMLNGPLPPPAKAGYPQWKTQNFAVITTTDQPPVAAFTPPSGLSTQPVSFDAGTSSDPDGTVAFYAWDFGDGVTRTGDTIPTTSHAYALPGTYTVTLTVTDNDGNTGRVSHDVVITNEPPVAAFTISPNPVLPGGTVSFDGSSSADSDGSIKGYAWDFGDGTTATGPSPQHSYPTPGTYKVTLTVTDNQNSTGQVSHTVTVDHPPTAAFSYAPATPAPTQPVAFDGRASSDPDGTVAAYAWDFGDGTSGGGPTPSHAYAAPGTYTVTLTVTDDHGAISAVSQAVSVAGQAPVVQALAPGAIGVHAAVLNGNVDPRGQATTYAFEYGPTAAYGSRTPDASLAARLGGLAASAAVSGLRAGSVLHYRLVATNASGTTASADQTLTTLRAPTPRVTLSATVSRRRRHLPSRITARGSVAPPPGATAGACSGNVTIQLRLGKRSAKRSLRLSSHCAFGGSVAVPSSLQRRGQLTVQASFAGSADLSPALSPKRRVR